MCYLQGFFDTEERSESGYQYSCNVDHQLELTEFKDIVVDGSAVEDSILDGLEVIIEDNDLACFLGSFGTAAHSKADISLFKCRAVVYAVACHTYNEVHFLTDPYHS